LIKYGFIFKNKLLLLGFNMRNIKKGGV
jgi:ADP-ribosylation factor-like protein 8